MKEIYAELGLVLLRQKGAFPETINLKKVHLFFKDIKMVLEDVMAV